MKKRSYKPGTGFEFEEEPSNEDAIRRQIEEDSLYDLIHDYPPDCPEDDDADPDRDGPDAGIFSDYYNDEDFSYSPPDCDADAEDCREQLDCELILRDCCVSGQECQECQGFLKCEENPNCSKEKKMTKATRVHEIIADCLYRQDELKDLKENKIPDGAIVVEGIMQTFGFHPERLSAHKSDIRELLSDLPDEFMVDKGGGMSFLQACYDRHGCQWAEHQTMDELFVLGQAIGAVKLLVPREVWNMLPGGMPYYSVNLHDDNCVG